MTSLQEFGTLLGSILLGLAACGTWSRIDTRRKMRRLRRIGPKPLKGVRYV